MAATVILSVAIAVVISILVAGRSMDLGRGRRGVLHLSAAEEPHIVWPAPGCPAVLERSPGGGWSVRMLLYAPRKQQDLGVRVTLLDVRDASPLASAGATSLRRSEIGDVECGCLWPEWVRRRYPIVWDIRFEFEGELAGEPTLFDMRVELGSDVEIERRSSVCRLPADGDPVRVFVATDLHLARRWDTLRDSAMGAFPVFGREEARGLDGDTLADRCDSADSFLDSFVDPSANLRHFFEQVNAAAVRGEVDAVILTGDLVDYVYGAPRGSETDESSEWQLFIDAMEGAGGGPRLRVPAFVAVGNHDYRLYPYRLSLYGARHAGVADTSLRRLPPELTGASGARIAPSDLDALRIDSGAHHSLARFFESICPFTVYHRSLGGAQLVVLDSGPDFYCATEDLMSMRAGRVLRALVTPSGGPRSLGFDRLQLRFLEVALASGPTERPVWLVSHAPLICPRRVPDGRGEAVTLGHVAVSAMAERQQRRAEADLARQGLDRGAIFRGHIGVLSALRLAGRRAVVLSGHSHWNLELRVDLGSGVVSTGMFSSENAVSVDKQGTALLLQTSALGHLKRSEPLIGFPAFRILEADGTATRRAEVRLLAARPFQTGCWDMVVVQRKPTTRLRFSSTTPAPPGTRQRAVLVFDGLEPDAVRAIASDYGQLVTCHRVSGRAYLVVDLDDAPDGEFDLRGLQPKQRFDCVLVVESPAGETLSLRRLHRTLRA